MRGSRPSQGKYRPSWERSKPHDGLLVLWVLEKEGVPSQE